MRNLVVHVTPEMIRHSRILDVLYFVDFLVKPFHVAGFGSAFWGALIISIVSMVANTLTGTGHSRIRFGRQVRPPGSPPVSPDHPKNGDGPIIDV